MTDRQTPAAPSWITLYYLSTPIFALADWMGANVRAVGLAGHPEMRAAYYVILTAAGGVLRVRPRWSAPIGLFESSANVLLLILAVLMPYFDAIDAVAAGGMPGRMTLTPEQLVNFVISGVVWAALFQRSILQLRSRRP